MRIRALSVFEGVVYHCHIVDRSNPCRPTLEVDARTQAGDLDQGPLLLTVADYFAMLDDDAVARDCVHQLREMGRVVDWMGVPHLSFPTWTQLESAP